jgi:hypothetical protein
MGIILGLAESSWVEIGVVIGPFLIISLIAFIVYKAKSVIMVEVESKIAEEIEPIEKRMDKHDIDFKEFKRDEIAPMKETLNELVADIRGLKVQTKTLVSGQGKIEKFMERILDKLDRKQDKK